jgi:hypothetical protein
MLARCDDGGLGNVCAEFARHLGPERVLLVGMGRSARGLDRPGRFTGLGCDVRTWPMGMLGQPDALSFLLGGVDTVFTAETWYDPLVVAEARRRGVRTVLLAMPELYDGAQEADETYVPTAWRLDLVPGAKVLPVPVDRDRLRFRRRHRVRTLYHPASPAMLDRNGTGVLLAALELCEEEHHVVVRRDAGPGEASVGRCAVEFRGRVEDYWLSYPDDADALVLPRRYAGLSLPMQEAASLGMLVVATDVSPQREWLPPQLRVAARQGTKHTMKGGRVAVHEPSAEDLAHVLDRLARAGEREVGRLSMEMGAHAHALSWDVLAPAWTEVLRR